jgi:hypothetical protein
MNFIKKLEHFFFWNLEHIVSFNNKKKQKNK